MDARFPLPEAPPKPTPQPEPDAQADARLLHRVARELVSRRLTTPAILFLESVKPMNYVGSQFLHFLDPIVRVFLTIPEYGHFADLLEKRETLEQLIEHIEAAQDAADATQLATREEAK